MRVLVQRLRVILALIILLGYLIANPAHAIQEPIDTEFLDGSSGAVSYYTACGRYWPASGQFETEHQEGANTYSATVRFVLTQAQINSLRCVGSYLEIDFRIFGFQLPGQWESYSISTDIPEALHDVSASDLDPSQQSPGITNIEVSSLLPGHAYFARISWSEALAPSNGPARVSIEWVPSYWASSVLQQELCLDLRNNNWAGDAWCIFGRTRAYLSHGYNSGRSLPFGGHFILPFPVSTQSQSTPSASNPYPGYGPKLAAVRNKDGRLGVFYVGGDNAIYYQFQTSPGGVWGAEQRLQAHIKAVAATTSVDGRIELFAIGSDNRVYNKWQWQPGTNWSAWGRLPAAAKSLAVTTNQDGRMELFMVGGDNRPWHIWQQRAGADWSVAYPMKGWVAA